MLSSKFDNPYPSEVLSTELIDLIQKNATKVSYPPNETIISPNISQEAFYCIHKGRVRITIITMDGKEQIIAILGKGALLGAPVMISKEKVNYNIITETPCVLHKIDHQQFWNLYHSSSIFNDAIVNNITDNYFRLMHQLESFFLKSCKERLYELLLVSVDKTSINDGYWFSISPQYSHDVMGKIIGSSRYTVTRLINELSKEDKIRVINNLIEVKLSALE